MPLTFISIFQKSYSTMVFVDGAITPNLRTVRRVHPASHHSIQTWCPGSQSERWGTWTRLSPARSDRAHAVRTSRPVRRPLIVLVLLGADAWLLNVLVSDVRS